MLQCADIVFAGISINSVFVVVVVYFYNL